jgi:D-glycero-D-manno-heptose 1,7-bisphosphate phosphatase
MKPAVFLDRDGTVCELVNYLSRPEQVKLIEGAGPAIRQLNCAGYVTVIVTNQSGIGRGYYSVGDFHATQRELARQLAGHQAVIDGVYFCAEVSDNPDKTAVDCFDRKPGPGMLLRAAEEHEIDRTRSWIVGDTISDMHAGRNAACKGCILVGTGYGAEQDTDDGAIDYIVERLDLAVELILRLDGKES